MTKGKRSLFQELNKSTHPNTESVREGMKMRNRVEKGKTEEEMKRRTNVEREREREREKERERERVRKGNAAERDRLY